MSTPSPGQFLPHRLRQKVEVSQPSCGHPPSLGTQPICTSIGIHLRARSPTSPIPQRRVRPAHVLPGETQVAGLEISAVRRSKAPTRSELCQPVSRTAVLVFRSSQPIHGCQSGKKGRPSIKLMRSQGIIESSRWLWRRRIESDSGAARKQRCDQLHDSWPLERSESCTAIVGACPPAVQFPSLI